LQPAFDSAAAKFNAIVDLPTPPLPLAIAIIFLILPSTFLSLFDVSTVLRGGLSNILILIS
jgi:hypothetical protein